VCQGTAGSPCGRTARAASLACLLPTASATECLPGSTGAVGAGCARTRNDGSALPLGCAASECGRPDTQPVVIARTRTERRGVLFGADRADGELVRVVLSRCTPGPIPPGSRSTYRRVRRARGSKRHPGRVDEQAAGRQSRTRRSSPAVAFFGQSPSPAAQGDDEHGQRGDGGYRTDRDRWRVVLDVAGSLTAFRRRLGGLRRLVGGLRAEWVRGSGRW
jgi:hypothetical protein